MDVDPKNKYKEEKNKIQNERRSFLKKTAYAAPSLIVLGQLARPNSAKAFGTPPSAPSESQQPW
jgi:hypothetical protein